MGSISISVKDIEGNDLLDPTTDYGFPWENITVSKVGSTLFPEEVQFNYSQEKGIYELMIAVPYYSSLVIISWNETESDTLNIVNRMNYSLPEDFELYLNGELQETYKYVELVKPRP
jgi:hypothetical protein